MAPRVNELVVALENPPLNLDPRVGTDQGAGRVWEVMLSGLVTKDTSGNLLPDLAESWEILDDGTRYRFHLRPQVTFHNGKPCTAADVVWSFMTLLDGTVISPKRGAFAQLQHVEAIDKHTVDFVLTEPYAAFPTNLTSFDGIIPDGTTPEVFNRQPIGTGPFRLVEHGPEHILFEPFENYWEGRPSLDRLIFRPVPDDTVRLLELRKGSVQLVVDLPPDAVAQFRQEQAFKVVEDPGSNYAYVGVNMEDPILRDPRVRRAIALSLDRATLVRTLWKGLGVVTETMMPPGHWAHHETLGRIPYDPEEARKLLDEAGFPDPDGDGPQERFRLSFKTSTREIYVLQAQILQSMMAAVGIEVDIRSYEFATFFTDIKQGNFQLFSLVWTGIIDPDIYNLTLHSAKIPPAGANRGRYRNAKFDQLIEQGARLSSPEERRPIYIEAQEILARDLPYISLYTKVNVAVMPAALEGYKNYPSGELYSLKQVRWTD